MGKASSRKYEQFGANYDWHNDRVVIHYIDNKTSGTLELGERELYAILLAHKAMMATHDRLEEIADDVMDKVAFNLNEGK